MIFGNVCIEYVFQYDLLISSKRWIPGSFWPHVKKNFNGDMNDIIYVGWIHHKDNFNPILTTTLGWMLLMEFIPTIAHVHLEYFLDFFY